MNDDGHVTCYGQGELCSEDAALHVAWGVIVVIIQAALSHSDGAALQKVVQRLHVAGSPLRSVVWVHTRSPKDEAGVQGGQLFGCFGLFERGADADHRTGARLASAIDYRVAVAVEGRVREVAVAVDEVFHALEARGYLRSIHRSTGAAM